MISSIRAWGRVLGVTVVALVPRVDALVCCANTTRPVVHPTRATKSPNLKQDLRRDFIVFPNEPGFELIHGRRLEDYSNGTEPGHTCSQMRELTALLPKECISGSPRFR